MKIPIKIKALNPDRTNYKKYGLMYEPERLAVELEISDKEVVSNDDICTTLTVAGLQELVGKLADLVDDIDAKHIQKYK